MTSTSGAAPSSIKVRNHRERLRAQSLRPMQIWVPDVRSPSFRSAAHLQSKAVATSATKADDQNFIDVVSLLDDELRGEK